jgi:hypothetical protein
VAAERAVEGARAGTVVPAAAFRTPAAAGQGAVEGARAGTVVPAAAFRAPAAAGQGAAEAPVVRVTIGRVEVRAVYPPAAPAPRPARAAALAAPSALEEYLRARDAGTRP